MVGRVDNNIQLLILLGSIYDKVQTNHCFESNFVKKKKVGSWFELKRGTSQSSPELMRSHASGRYLVGQC